MDKIPEIKKNNEALLTGNEAIAIGAFKAGVTIATGYPGTPSSEILPYLARFKNIIVNWSINEKTALEIAIGASIGYGRSLFTTKHVGLNVASDPLMTLAITGVRGGIVIITADDPNMHSSQNEQDNRFYSKFAKVPMFEPADSDECLRFTELAFEVSEKFDTPVLVRTTTRISHSKSIVSVTPECLPDLTDYSAVQNRYKHLRKPQKTYVKDIEKFVMAPVYARKRHKIAIERLKSLQGFSNTSDINKIEYNGTEFGIITGGVAYQHAKEAAPFASFLKLSFSYPLPDLLIKEFVKNVKNIIVIEELEPFIQNELSSMGINIKGKEFFSRHGELTPDSVSEGLLVAGFIPQYSNDRQYTRRGENGIKIENRLSAPDCSDDPVNIADIADKNSLYNLLKKLPARLPALCSGCPHTSVFYALKKLKVPVMGDIGCYTLGALPPLSAMDSCISMGLAFGAAQGLFLSNASSKKIAGVMGDSTFFHSGITSLIDAQYNNACFTAIILDNSTTAMTGGQDHPGTGKNLSSLLPEWEKEQVISNKIDIKKIVEGMGIKEIYTIDPYDYNETYKTLKTALSSENLNVVITKRPCVLYPKKIDLNKKFKISDGCNGCDLCTQTGCPSIINSDRVSAQKRPIPFIDGSCIGCSICKDICIFNFIEEIPAAGK